MCTMGTDDLYFPRRCLTTLFRPQAAVVCEPPDAGASSWLGRCGSGSGLAYANRGELAILTGTSITVLATSCILAFSNSIQLLLIHYRILYRYIHIYTYVVFVASNIFVFGIGNRSFGTVSTVPSSSSRIWETCLRTVRKRVRSCDPKDRCTFPTGVSS